MKNFNEFINERLILNPESKIKFSTILDVRKEGKFDYKGVSIRYDKKYLYQTEDHEKLIIKNIDYIFLSLGKIIDKFENEFKDENIMAIFYNGPSEPGCNFSLQNKYTRVVLGSICIGIPHNNKDKILSGEYFYFSLYWQDSPLSKKLEQFIQPFSHPFNEDIHERLILNNQTKIQKSPNNDVIEFCKFLSELFKEDTEMIDLGEVEAMLSEDPLGIKSYIEYNNQWKCKEFNDFTLREKMLLCEFVNAYINKKDYDKSLKFAINFFNSDSYYEDWKQHFNYDED